MNTDNNNTKGTYEKLHSRTNYTVPVPLSLVSLVPCSQIQQSSSVTPQRNLGTKCIRIYHFGHTKEDSVCVHSSKLTQICD